MDMLVLKKAPTVFEETIHRALSKRIKGCILLPYGLVDFLKFKIIFNIVINLQTVYPCNSVRI